MQECLEKLLNEGRICSLPAVDSPNDWSVAAALAVPHDPYAGGIPVAGLQLEEAHKYRALFQILNKKPHSVQTIKDLSVPVCKPAMLIQRLEV